MIPPLVGILGGMGPAATAYLYQRIIALTPARTDQEHLAVTIWADPSVPDRTEALLGVGADPTPTLVSGARKLREAGAELVAIACNTAHAFAPAVEAAAGCEPRQAFRIITREAVLRPAIMEGVAQQDDHVRPQLGGLAFEPAQGLPGVVRRQHLAARRVRRPLLQMQVGDDQGSRRPDPQGPRRPQRHRRSADRDVQPPAGRHRKGSP